MTGTLPAFVTDHAPLIVSSPTIRSGTTLVQRLLCSSRNALIYGETCGQDVEFFLQIAQSKALLYQHNKPQFEAGLRRFQAGEVNDWILDLMPEIDPYVRALTEGALAGLAYCREAAADQGRTVWGFKYPGWPPQTIGLLRRVMPRSRWLYVYRDVAACLQSAKAWGEVHSLEEAHAFCRAWAENLCFAQTLVADSNVLLLDYAVLVGAPAESLTRIAAFSGAEGMDPAVFDHKINTWTGGIARPQGESYLPPMPLSDEENGLAREARTVVGGINANLTSNTTS